MRLASLLAASVVAIGVSAAATSSQGAQLAPLKGLEANQSLATPVAYGRYCWRWRSICADRGVGAARVSAAACGVTAAKFRANRAAAQLRCCAISDLFVHPPQAGREYAHHPQRKLRVIANNGQKGLFVDGDDFRRLGCHCGCTSRSVVDQRHLAEDAAGADVLEYRPIGYNVDPARPHHIHGVAWVFLEENFLAGFEMAKWRANTIQNGKIKWPIVVHAAAPKSASNTG